MGRAGSRVVFPVQRPRILAEMPRLFLPVVQVVQGEASTLLQVINLGRLFFEGTTKQSALETFV